MRCPCGFDNAADAKFCASCGAPLAVVSSTISARTPPEATAAAPAQARVPTRELPPQVAASPRGRHTLPILAAVALVAAFGYWWLNRPTGWYQWDNSGLYRISENGKFGYADPSGRSVIAPQFDDAKDFSERMAPVRIGDKWGYINTKGALTITPQFTDGMDFLYGRAPVKLCCGRWLEHHSNDRYGFIDPSGKQIGSLEFSWVGMFSGNRYSPLAPVQQQGGSFGFVDRSGKLAIPAKFEGATPFGFTEGTAPVASNGKWGYIDMSGKWVIEPQFDGASNFSGGLAFVLVSGKFGYIGSVGKFIINPQFDEATFFFDGKTTPIRRGLAWGLIDRNGNAVGDAAAFLDVGFVNEGRRPVRTAEGWGYIDGDGKLVIAPKFDSALQFLGGLARVTIGTREAYIDKTGAYIGDPFKGRTVIPAHAVKEVWEGDVVAPKWTDHQKFLLEREGAQIKGHYIPQHHDPSSLSDLGEVAGKVNPDHSVRIVSETGLIWKGQFVSPEVIVGKRPNGEEGSAPEFPFRLHLVREASPDEMPAPLPPTTSAWDTFLAEFKRVVAERNQSALAVMMDRAFFLRNANIGTQHDVFRQIKWQELDKALADGSITTRKSPLGRELRFITDSHPCPDCRYSVELGFGEDRNGQWRWTGVNYPGD